MASPNDSGTPSLPPAEESGVREILGYLNFSNGTADARFQRNWNAWQISVGLNRPLTELRDQLLGRLEQLRRNSSAFADTAQAEAVVRLVFDDCLPAYRQHHQDLLFHLSDEDFQQPFFIARVLEATLAQGPPWDDTQRIVTGTLGRLNDFLGFRPLAVLENGRQMEPYPHERCRPVPLYIRDAGVAAGKYHALVQRTIDFFRETPAEILHDAHFDLLLLDELALDMRAHDHTHPVNKRTNYMFGEWDPHLIDVRGCYRRFVVRKIILDSLLNWMKATGGVKPEELLYDASAVLCGTMLMASSISGSGPDTHDSNVTLTSLLPKVARQRDAFYARLLQNASGARARRLNHEAQLTQQPFGHVRQYLNINLATYGAGQVQYRYLAQLFARMGYPQASRQQATMIPSAAARFECEIVWRLRAAHLHLDRSELHDTLRCLQEIEDHLQRGVLCSALVDPWNILGFQAQFPLFSSREDSVPDHRAEMLLEMLEQIYGVYSRALGEAATAGDEALTAKFSEGFRKLADHWDQFATTVVEELPRVSGHESYESALRVSQALSQWRAAGEAAGDISFWRQHVDRFQSAKSYALAVEASLQKHDHVAAMGLLMQWLSQAEEVGLESGPHSFFQLLVRWMNLVTNSTDESGRQVDSWPTLRRLFDYLEANAGEYWSVARLENAIGEELPPLEEAIPNEDGSEDELFDSEDEGLFDAAYDGVVYRDSAADGHDEDTLEVGGPLTNTEFDVMARQLEPRLKFIHTLSHLWQMAAAACLSNSIPPTDSSGEIEREKSEEKTAVLRDWCLRAGQLQQELFKLMQLVWSYKISPPTGDYDSNVEYDMQLQTKFDVLRAIIATDISCQSAEQCLMCCIPGHALDKNLSDEKRQIVEMYRSVFRRDVPTVRRLLPKFLKQLLNKPLLYVPFHHGGDPRRIRAARNLQAMIRLLLAQLPQLGMLRETWHVLQTAYRMERRSRPPGPVVTEFDWLFRTALKNSLECVIQSSSNWKSGKFSDEDLIEIVGDVVERYLDVWLKHSKTMRLSSAEGLEPQPIWEDVKKFIDKYGADLFHGRMLMPLGNVRAILHNGIEWFLDTLAETQDPLRPIRLLDDLDRGEIDREQVIASLELIFGSVVDKFDRFLEYNTTTTQSDYGEMFYCLLDFLRVESGYERDEWNLAPVGMAHEVLTGLGKHDAAMIWEKVFQSKTGEMAKQHLTKLEDLEKTYGMRLPSIADHLNERFIKPLAVNRMLALVPRAMQDARGRKQPSESFTALRAEIEEYLESTSGSAIDAPAWLRSLEQEIHRAEADSGELSDQAEPDIKLPPVTLSLREMRRQLKVWDQRKKKKKPDG